MIESNRKEKKRKSNRRETSRQDQNYAGGKTRSCSRNLTATVSSRLVSFSFSSVFLSRPLLPFFSPSPEKNEKSVETPIVPLTTSSPYRIFPFFIAKPPSSRLYSPLHPLVRPVSTFSTLLPRTWVGRSTRRFTRRLSSSAPRKTIRCVTCCISP